MSVDMRKSFPKWLLAVISLSSAAWPQGGQNRDICFAAGPAWARSRQLPRTSLRQADSWGDSIQLSFGYQMARVSATSVWADISVLASAPGNWVTGAGIASDSWAALTLGMRFMVPVHARVSLLAEAGGGDGTFGRAGSVGWRSAPQGVFVPGGGVDVRLTPRFSLRAEIRDVVTGRQLGGVPGRQHLAPLFGVAFHL
jgi:hypothetical protein